MNELYVNGFCLDMKMALPRYHVSFDVIEKYLRESSYPSEITATVNKGKKANFRKACKPFSILNGQLMYNNTLFLPKKNNKQ